MFKNIFKKEKQEIRRQVQNLIDSMNPERYDVVGKYKVKYSRANITIELNYDFYHAVPGSIGINIFVLGDYLRLNEVEEKVVFDKFSLLWAELSYKSSEFALLKLDAALLSLED